MPCATRSPPPLDAAQWTPTIASKSPTATSTQLLDAAAKAIVTRAVCAELSHGESAVVKQWFRYTPPEQVARRSDSSCTAGGAPRTPRGALTDMRTSINGAWAEAGKSRPTAGVSWPCAALQTTRVRLHDYCVPLARFGHAPPNQTLWHRGVSLLGNEMHIDNFHHFNRDLCAVVLEPLVCSAARRGC